jgi:hypothetical protein
MIRLRINHTQMRDSSACVARHGEFPFAGAEKDLSPMKKDPHLLAQAPRACLDPARVLRDHLDFMCSGRPPAPAQTETVKVLRSARYRS